MLFTSKFSERKNQTEPSSLPSFCLCLPKLNKWTLQYGVPLISGMKALAKCLLSSRQAFKEIFFWRLLWQSPVISANLLLAKWVQVLTNFMFYNILSFSFLSKWSKSLNYLSLLIYKDKLLKFWNKNFHKQYIVLQFFLLIPPNIFKNV